MSEAPPSVWTRLSHAAVVAMAGVLTAAPYLYYLAAVAFADRVQGRFGLSSREVLAADLPLAAAAVSLSALIGALFSARYGLPGLGDRARVQQALKRFGALALLVSVVGYFTVGRALAARVPGTFPEDVGWAAVVWAKSAVFDEIVARYGMLTVLWSVTRRGWLANLLQAAFFTATVMQGLRFLGAEASSDLVFAGSLALTFAGHLLMGAAQLRYGLVATIALRAAWEARYLLHAALV